jgi:hypothetical protein
MGNNEEKRPQGELIVYQGQGLNAPVQVRLEGENVWLSQKLIAELYGTTVANINQHISSIYEDEELLPEATIKKYLIVQIEGTRQVKRLIDHYNLEMIKTRGKTMISAQLRNVTSITYHMATPCLRTPHRQIASAEFAKLDKLIWMNWEGLGNGE